MEYNEISFSAQTPCLITDFEKLDLIIRSLFAFSLRLLLQKHFVFLQEKQLLGV